ncbi:4'-phosphopantetheinyl transferase family protein [Streptomyces chattanoogensis]
MPAGLPYQCTIDSFSDVVPSCVEVAQSTCDLPSGATSRELESLGWAVPARQAEFATGRVPARRALAVAGAPAGDLLRDSSGAPTWPSGFIGSITHCSGFRAAAVAARRDVCALGIDVELHRPLAAELVDAIAAPQEQRAWLFVPGLWPEVVTFSAKESAYKAYSGLGSGFLDFPDVHVELKGQERLREDAWSGTFDAHLRRRQAPPGLPPVVRGRWRAAGSLVFTAVVLEAAAGVGRCA